ncbi:MAG: heavy-metal-associated domain-containing protein [Bacilli bacterium]|jgi:copper chaperone CopZ|nr:heavy-metal-associated domain-containing protein [Bacilli bacterium]MCI2111629.1 heavy-metal-associated domain-containing protein [Bacilli bacterium]
MLEIHLSIEGMKCGMCECHVEESLSKVAKVKKAKADHYKNEATVIAEDGVDLAQLKETVEKEGYRVLDVEKREYARKGPFSFLRKR